MPTSAYQMLVSLGLPADILGSMSSEEEALSITVAARCDRKDFLEPLLARGISNDCRWTRSQTGACQQTTKMTEGKGERMSMVARSAGGSMGGERSLF